MGNRLHVAKVYNVEYATTEAFNWAIEEFHVLLSALNVDYTGEIYDEDFEVEKKEWVMGFERLKNLETLDPDMQEEINNALNGLGYRREEVMDLFLDYLDASDPKNNFMHFSFF